MEAAAGVEGEGPEPDGGTLKLGKLSKKGKGGDSEGLGEAEAECPSSSCFFAFIEEGAR